MLARRLLLGSASFPVAPPVGPPDDAAWTRATPYNPILVGEAGWTAQAVGQPSVQYIAGAWHGWFAGVGSSGDFMGAMDSADGLSWSHHLTAGVDAPVLGGGHGGLGVGVSLYQPHVNYWDGTYFYAYFDDPTGSPNFCLSVARSTDGYTWTDLTRNILGFASGVSQWNNTAIIRIGSTYYMLVEGLQSPNYQTFYATASAPFGPWTLGNGGVRLTSLIPAGCPGASGSNIHLLSDGLIHNYFHAGPNPTSDLYAATISLADFLAGSDSWTLGNGGAAILTHSGTGREASQIGDPCLVQVGTEYRLYHTAVADQDPFTATLEMATAPAT